MIQINHPINAFIAFCLYDMQKIRPVKPQHLDELWDKRHGVLVETLTNVSRKPKLTKYTLAVTVCLQESNQVLKLLRLLYLNISRFESIVASPKKQDLSFPPWHSL